MFERPNVPLKITDIGHSFKVEGETEVPLITIQLELTPLTSELANEISEFMRTVLFTRQDAAVNTQLAGATFNVIDRAQTLEFRMAPDQSSESFKAEEVSIGPLSARRTGKTTVWKLVFTATWSPTGERQLAQVCDCLTKVRYVSFGDQHPNLITEAERTERAERSGGRRTH